MKRGIVIFLICLLLPCLAGCELLELLADGARLAADILEQNREREEVRPIETEAPTAPPAPTMAPAEELPAEEVTVEEIPEEKRVETVCWSTNYEEEQGYEYGLIEAYNAQETLLWQRETRKYERGQLPWVTRIGRRGDCFYYAEGGTVVCLNVQTGMVLWENSDFADMVEEAVFGEDALYLCGYFGPDFYAIGYNGETLVRIASFDPNYYWADEIELQPGMAVVYMEGISGYGYTEEPIPVYVNLDTYAYRMGQVPAEVRDNAWRYAYELFVTEQAPQLMDLDYCDEQYMLLDINGDDVPELYIHTGITASGDRICTYADGEVKSEWVWAYGLYYLPGQNLFLSSGGHMGSYFDGVCCIDGDEFEFLCGGEYGDADPNKVQYDANGDPIYRYFWEDVEVTKEEYEARLTEALRGLEPISPLDGRVYSYNEIFEAIYSYPQ